MHPFHHAAATPDKPAYIMAETGETVTYRLLEDRSNQVAQMLRALGLKAGDHIVFQPQRDLRPRPSPRGGWCGSRLFEAGLQPPAKTRIPKGHQEHFAEIQSLCGDRLFRSFHERT